MPKKLFIANIYYNATEDELRLLFEQYGKISSLKIIKNPDSEMSRGFGFIEMYNADKAKNELHGKEFKGLKLKVLFAASKENRGKKGSGHCLPGGKNTGYKYNKNY